MKKMLIILSLLLNLLSFAQLSENSKIYLITCEVGDEIYTQFGHSALRVVDPASGQDITFNWGVFEVPEDQVDFMYKFAKATLPYYMDVTSTKQFVYPYWEIEKREVRQQELNLNLEQKNKIWKMLQTNALPENKYYKYDFFFDNCATRIRDIFNEALGQDIIWAEHPEAGEHTFREMIDQGYASHPWLDFGIDLVLGYRIDQQVNNMNLMFNPFYMEEIFEESQIQTGSGLQNLVLSNEIVTPGTKRSEASGVWFTPLVLTISILVITLIFAFFRLDVLLKIWASLLLFITGLLGILLIFMWVGTDHVATKGNLNLLWANPLWLVLMVLLWVKKWQVKLASTYLYLSLGMLALVLFFLMLPQEFHVGSRVLIINWTILFYFFYRNQIMKEKKDQTSL
ncbi:Lnb N-terminal periplasmic domain-containing protein [Parvicella tangerina]|uniref:DUF4105 domain-containing protein n=1 Tax=Parvicella tangerina TaxID=2829795 RepID=A0A916JKG2_9FLAO|nr:DUF4105 domain-containing protein [Parvicella tangerina]CAG5078207.1 hypothetical protein CRYO30217_00606 [Parvicella tangerina]